MRLRIEGEQELADTYGKVRGLWYAYTSQYADLLAHHSHGEIVETLMEMQSAVDAILDKTRADMAKLSTPI